MSVCRACESRWEGKMFSLIDGLKRSHQCFHFFKFTSVQNNTIVSFVSSAVCLHEVLLMRLVKRAHISPQNLLLYWFKLVMQSLFLYCRTITSCLSKPDNVSRYIELKYDPSVRVTHLCVRSKQRWKDLMLQFVCVFLKPNPQQI